jgi:pyruvate,orthophosphate dikinase
MEAVKQEAGAANDVDLTAADLQVGQNSSYLFVGLAIPCFLQRLCNRYEAVYASHTGGAFPDDPRAMLRAAVVGVVRSWGNPRAVKYRALNRITGQKGTAVTVQLMVFGNAGPSSGK